MFVFIIASRVSRSWKVFALALGKYTVIRVFPDRFRGNHKKLAESPETTIFSDKDEITL